jgi:hypothetical protein
MAAGIQTDSIIAKKNNQDEKFILVGSLHKKPLAAFLP